MSNAIKFTPEGGVVTVTAVLESDGRVAVSVADTGIGIAREDIPKALASFSQIQKDSTVYYSEGTGLGLPLTQALIRLHGGTLVVESQKGEGTTVTARFPLDRVVLHEESEIAKAS
jgi:Amt family ammonium transporter